MKKIFRKYSNRRLYDVNKKEYVNLEDVKKEILNFHTIEVIDAKTKEDLTNSILLQIINKQDSDSTSKVMTSQALINLILLYESPFSAIISQYLDGFLSWLHMMNGPLEEQQTTSENKAEESSTKDNEQYAPNTADFTNPMANFAQQNPFLQFMQWQSENNPNPISNFSNTQPFSNNFFGNELFNHNMNQFMQMYSKKDPEAPKNKPNKDS